MERKVIDDGKARAIQELDNGRILLKVDKAVYDREAVVATAYKLTDTCFIHVDSAHPGHYAVYFSAKQLGIDLISQVDSFCNELIDQQLRQDLGKSNKSIKEMIVKKAFFPFQNNE